MHGLSVISAITYDALQRFFIVRQLLQNLLRSVICNNATATESRHSNTYLAIPKKTKNSKATGAVEQTGHAPVTKLAQQAWPALLPEQVRAVADVLAASFVPLGLDALAAHFKGRGPWKKSLPTLQQPLEALGRVHGSGQGDSRQWHSWQR